MKRERRSEQLQTQLKINASLNLELELQVVYLSSCQYCLLLFTVATSSLRQVFVVMIPAEELSW